MQNGSTNQSAEILARSRDFVPTAFQGSDAASAEHVVDWQTAMKRAIRSSSELRNVLGLTPPQGTARGPRPEGETTFPTFVPWEFLSRIVPGDSNDPLLRQVLALADEDAFQPGFSSDPVGDLPSMVAGGLIHKYHGRALVIANGACGIHCRYCFRREFPYSTAGSRSSQWEPSIDHLRSNHKIDEVILSGGDPLTLVEQKLGELVGAIESVPHVRRLRIHTRMPIVIPQRVTAELVDRLRASRLAVWIVVHCNHPNELDDSVLDRLGMLIDAGIPVLNQAVLLRGVNDDAATLIQLCRTLVDHRIQPYYLHQLDKVRGAAHFEVPIETGQRLMNELHASLPGYAVPRYVVEEAGESSKTTIRSST